MGNKLTVEISLEEATQEQLRTGIYLAVAVYGIYQLGSYGYWKYRSRQVRAQGRRVTQEKANQKYDFKQVPNAEYILSLEAHQIRGALIEKKFSVKDIVSLYCQRCYTIGREYGLSADEIFEQALEMADKLDKQLEEALKQGITDQLPPLFGVPFSIKDMIEMKGTRSTMGCDYLANNISKKNAAQVQMLLDAGAIPIVKGNIPQFANAIHSENRVYGLAVNPFNKNRSCGGSSGGDAGIIATRCAVLSLINDSGGSIRIPSAFNGIFGFKPTANRVGNKGTTSVYDSPIQRIKMSTGCGGRSVDDLILAFKAQTQPNLAKLDTSLPEMPFNEDKFKQGVHGKIKVGFLDSYSFLPATDAVKRGVQEAKQALEEQGFEMIPFALTAEEVAEMFEVSLSIGCDLDLYGTFQACNDNYEPLMPCYQFAAFISKANVFIRFLVLSLLALMGEARVYRLAKILRPLSKEEFNKLGLRLEELANNLQEKWEALEIQALVMPAFPTAAITNAGNEDMGVLVHYSFFWNIVDFPAGVVPVTRVKENEHQHYEDAYGDMWTKAIKKDIIDSTGMPIGVQVVAKKWQDEICLGVMQAIDKKIQFRNYAL